MPRPCQHNHGMMLLILKIFGNCRKINTVRNLKISVFCDIIYPFVIPKGVYVAVNCLKSAFHSFSIKPLPTFFDVVVCCRWNPMSSAITNVTTCNVWWPAALFLHAVVSSKCTIVEHSARDTSGNWTTKYVLPATCSFVNHCCNLTHWWWWWWRSVESHLQVHCVRKKSLVGHLISINQTCSVDINISVCFTRQCGYKIKVR